MHGAWEQNSQTLYYLAIMPAFYINSLTASFGKESHTIILHAQQRSRAGCIAYYSFDEFLYIQVIIWFN